MKKVIFICLLLISYKSMAQYSVGFSAGIIVPVKTDTKKMSASAAASFAIETIVPVYKGLKFRTGLSYYTFNYTQKDTIILKPIDSVYYDTLRTFDHNASYLTIPVGFRYIYDKKQLKPFIEAGIMAMIKVDGNGRKHAETDIISPYFTLGVKQSWENKMYFCASIHGFLPSNPIYNKGGHYYYTGLGGYLTLGYDF